MCALVVKSGRSLMTSLFTTRNEHAALSFKQLIGKGEDTVGGAQLEEEGGLYQDKPI